MNQANARPAQPRLAATVVVLRPLPSGLDALMVRRNTALSFCGGDWVFPGGAVDAGDFDVHPISIRAAAFAGSRELREEAGLMLDPDDLVHWSRWITPSSLPRRYDTHFFIAAAPGDQEPTIVEGEVTAMHWLPVVSWPELSTSGPFPVPQPTQIVLREIAEAFERYGSLEVLLQRERGRVIQCFMPKMCEEARAALPWDLEYSRLPDEGIAWNQNDIVARRHWPSRF